MTSAVSAPFIEADDVRTCYLCGSDGEDLHAGLRDSLFGVAGVWNLRRCSRCGLVWLSPRPRREEIPKLYERYYTHSPPVAGDGATESLGRATREAALRRVCGYDAGGGPGRLRRFLAEGLGRLGPVRDAAAGSVLWLGASRRGRLLDVGCGTGLFLAQMRDLGWEVEGVEPDPVAAHAARSRYRLDITSAPLEEVSLPANTFDAVTASHVIEHVHDPIGFLMECGRLLRPGGAVVIVTPNSRSLGSHWFRGSWRGWEVPRHIFVFSPRTLRTCAERAGLRVEELRTTARSARYIWHSSRALRRPATVLEEKGWQGFQAVSFWFLEHLMIRVIHRGEEILLMARRSR